MRRAGATVRMGWRVARGICALAALLVLAASANAQEDDGGALRFLKPWIERQLFGRETSEPPVAPAAPVAPAEGAPPSGEAAPDQVAPPAEAPSESLPDVPSVSALDGDVPPPSEAPASAETPVPTLPPTDTTAASPDALTEPPGVPVEAKPEALRFAVLAGRSTAATMAAIGPMAEELQGILGRPVEILPLASYTAMIDAQVQRRIDGGFYSAAAFAAADSACACLEPVVAPRASDGTLAYHAVIVARAGSGIAALADMAGKTVAIGAVDSIGARHMQLAGLLAEGIDPATTFGAVLEVESAEAAVRLVASGAADAAFAWSSLAGGVESGYSRGTLTQLVAAGGIAMNTLAIIWSSPPIAHGPFAVMRTLPEEDKTKIESYLAALSGSNPTAYDTLDPFYGGGYAPVEPQDYAGLETLLAENVDAVRLPGGPATTGATATSPDDAPLAPAPAAPN